MSVDAVAPDIINLYPTHNICINGLPHASTGIILGMGWANERRRYIVISSPIGWTNNQNDPYSGIS